MTRATLNQTPRRGMSWAISTNRYWRIPCVSKPRRVVVEEARPAVESGALEAVRAHEPCRSGTTTRADRRRAGAGLPLHARQRADLPRLDPHRARVDRR